LCYAEHEKAHANAAYVPVLTGECQVIAGFRFKVIPAVLPQDAVIQ